MFKGKKIVVVLPAYNAELTLERTYREIPFHLVDEVILVDDASGDHTIEVARTIGIKNIIRHDRNKGYGGNQKTCYDKALELGGDIVIMLHPDYQYTPLLMEAMVSVLGSGLYKVVLGSRVLGRGALRGGMPLYKYIANRLLTLFQNFITGQKLSEYHTGYRAFTREVLQRINYHADSDDFVFDNQMISQIFMAGYEIAEITCPAKYFEEASSINFSRSVIYGMGVLKTAVMHFLHKNRLARFRIYGERVY